ncbi:MAG: hypothetical protein V1678_04615 [Candidatus Aenigmatarchaeota archaeon]
MSSGRGPGIFVMMIDPLKDYAENQAVADLERLMKKNAHHYEEVGGESRERYWTIDKKGKEKGTMDTEIDDSKLMYGSESLNLSFLDLKDGRILVRESVSFSSYIDKFTDADHDKYYLFEGGKLVTQPSRIMEILKDEVKIKIPSMKIKDTMRYCHPYVAEFITKPEKIEPVVDVN